MQAVHGRGVSLIEPWAVALCCAVLPLPSAAADEPAPQIARAEKIVNGKCFICHGIEGETSSQAFPRLAGSMRCTSRTRGAPSRASSAATRAAW